MKSEMILEKGNDEYALWSHECLTSEGWVCPLMSFPQERRPHNSEEADLQIYLKQANLSTKDGPSWML